MKIIAIMSGKGGVGKSSICTLVSMVLSENAKVMLLDFDICGPSINTALNVSGAVYKGSTGLVPVSAAENLDVLSMASLIRQGDSVIWRGPKKVATLDLFFESIGGKYDYVVIDTPPGLAEEHWFLCEKGVKSIIVSTPQNIALSNTISSVDFCVQNGIEILGVFENMSGLKCEKCSSVTNVFGTKGVEHLAKTHGIRHLGTLPMDLGLIRAVKEGSIVQEKENLISYQIIKEGIKDIV